MKTILNIILQLCAALRDYMQLKNTSFYYEISDKHNERKAAIIGQITQLRNVGSSAATDNADRLRLVLEEEERRWESVSAAYLSPPSGPDDKH